MRFLQALDDRPAADVRRIAQLLGFGRAEDLENWIPTVAPLAYELERLAPALAIDGPNRNTRGHRTPPFRHRRLMSFPFGRASRKPVEAGISCMPSTPRSDISPNMPDFRHTVAALLN